MAKKQPYINFFVNDWLADAALRACSLAARGLWMDTLCLMQQSDEPGYLLIGGKPTTTEQLARTVGASEEEVCRLLSELEYAGVYSRDDDGRIYSRRLAREAQLSDTRADAGRLGGKQNVSKVQAKSKQNVSKVQAKSKQSPSKT